MNERQTMQIIIALNQTSFIYLLYLSIATPNWLLIEFPTAIITTVNLQTKTVPITRARKKRREEKKRAQQ